MQTGVDNATTTHASQTHAFDARVPHNIQNAQSSAYEHSNGNARIRADSRVGIAACRWQVAAGAGGSLRMWPKYVQCGGAGRGSVALTGSRHRQYPRSSFLHEVALRLWSKLWTPFDLSVSQKSRNEKCYLRDSVRLVCKPGQGDLSTTLINPFPTLVVSFKESSHFGPVPTHDVRRAREKANTSL